jgi:hypothetical protein
MGSGMLLASNGDAAEYSTMQQSHIWSKTSMVLRLKYADYQIPGLLP